MADNSRDLVGLYGRAQRAGVANRITPGMNFDQIMSILRDAETKGELPAPRGDGVMGKIAKIAGPIMAGAGLGSAITPLFANMAPAVGASGAQAGGGGFLGKLGSLATMPFKTGGKFDWGKLGKAGMAAMAFKGHRDDTKRGDEFMARDQAQRDMFMKLAQDQYAGNEPYRKLALEKLGSIGGGNPATKYLKGK